MLLLPLEGDILLLPLVGKVAQGATLKPSCMYIDYIYIYIGLLQVWFWLQTSSSSQPEETGGDCP